MPAHIALANVAARLALRVPTLERALVAGMRRPVLRRHLRLGAIANGYPRVLREPTARVAELDGYRLCVHVSEPLGVVTYFEGASGALDVTRRLVRPGDVCFDVGANVGPYTFLCAKLVGKTGRVVAFEPNEQFGPMLRRSVAINGFEDVVSIDTRAVFRKSRERLTFFLSQNTENLGTSSLVNHGVFVSEGRTTTVTTVSLDDYTREAGIDRLRFVKVDVERAEDDVIAGARQLLEQQRIDSLVVEMVSGTEAQRSLEAAGYAGYLVKGGTLVPSAQLERVYGDFLFVRRGVDVDALR